MHKFNKDKFCQGDRVMYSRDFLRSTGQFTGRSPFVRGVVEGIAGFAGKNDLVNVTWNDGHNSNVLSCNLVLAKNLHLESR